MEEKKTAISEDLLDEVVGGLFTWHKKSKRLTYTHDDGSVTEHKVLDYDKAWERSNILHSQHIHEDKILNDLISKGYIQG